MDEEKLLARIESLNDRADDLEDKAEDLNWQADNLRDKAMELDGDEMLKLLDEADKLEEKADRYTERAETLREKADELEEKLTDLRYNVEIEEPPKPKPKKPKVEEPLWDNSKQRLKEAFNTWLEMAQVGNVNAIYEVGNCFYYGTGVDQNVEESLKWYDLAAQGGSVAAMNQINEMFLRGESPEMCKYMPNQLPSQPARKKSKSSWFSTKNKTYDGSFSNVDPKLAALYNSEKFGYEENAIDFDDDDD